MPTGGLHLAWKFQQLITLRLFSPRAHSHPGNPPGCYIRKKKYEYIYFSEKFKHACIIPTGSVATANSYYVWRFGYGH